GNLAEVHQLVAVVQEPERRIGLPEGGLFDRRRNGHGAVGLEGLRRIGPRLRKSDCRLGLRDCRRSGRGFGEVEIAGDRGRRGRFCPGIAGSALSASGMSELALPEASSTSSWAIATGFLLAGACGGVGAGDGGGAGSATAMVMGAGFTVATGSGAVGAAVPPD